MSTDTISEPNDLTLPSPFPDWETWPPAPWRRYGARALDIAVGGGLGWLFIGFLWYIVAPVSADVFFNTTLGEGGQFIDIVLTVLVSCVLNALALSFIGTTLGKWIFGIKVLPLVGNRLSPGAAFKRELNVWIWGLGLGIPILTVIANLTAYNRLTKERATSWDKGRFNIIYRKRSNKQTMLNILGIILIITARVGLIALAAQT